MKLEELAMRITRARAKYVRSSGGVPSISESSFNDERSDSGGVSLKRAAEEEIIKPKIGIAGSSSNGQNKRRAVMKDISNLVCNNVVACTDTIQVRKPWVLKSNAKAIPPTASTTPLSSVDGSHTEILSKGPYMGTFRNTHVEAPKFGGSTSLGFPPLAKCRIAKAAALPNSISNEVNSEICDDLEACNKLAVIDIDSTQKDPKWCCVYALEIYKHLRVIELQFRPTDIYMDTIQKYITQGMRAILVDWLAEVSEEYKLVPDTLYLTVNLIDRYLSLNYIERKELQLLGVTCMLIASKYEEICAPHVEDLCFVTDNTYSKQQVIEMERRVVNLLSFRLSVPTTKTFLRRFVRAAQSCECDEAHVAELELMSNYLSELSLMEYSFVNLLPSLVAASAVFLARWTLNQSDHPWNSTLECHTNYKTHQLKPVIIEMQSLQRNINACPLNAIREKYKSQKFKCVATLLPATPVESLF